MSSQVEAPSSTLQSRRERIEDLGLEAEELRAKRQLKQIRREQKEEEADRRDGEEANAKRELYDREAIALERRRLARQEEREREKSLNAHKLEQFRARWLKFGNDLLFGNVYAWISESQRQEIFEAIEDEVASRDLSDEERMNQIIRRILVVAVEPWKQAKEDQQRRANIVDRVVGSLPYGISDEQRCRAALVARQALSRVPSGSDDELKIIASDAVRPIQNEIERATMFERVVSAAVFEYLPIAATTDDKEMFRRKCERVLSKLPDDANEVELKHALKKIGAEASTQIQEREDLEETKKRRLALISYGLREASTYLSRLCFRGEIEYEDVQELQESVAESLDDLEGDESFADVGKFVCSIIDDEEES